jgi:uncharacterized protein
VQQDAKSSMANNSRRKWMKRFAIGGVLLVALWLVASYVVVYKFTRRARPMFDEPAPSSIADSVQALRLTASDGEQIGAWFIAGKPDRPVVLILHGNGASRAACLGQAELVGSIGCGVLLITFRAHGDSTGELNDFGYGAHHDVVAAVEWVKKNTVGQQVIVWGQSLGSAAALFAAEGLGNEVAGYIFECPYRDLRTAVWNRLNQRLPLPLNYVAYTGMKLVSPLVVPHAKQISPLNAAAKLPSSIPVLVLAGGIDQRAFVVESQEICECCKDRSQLVVFENADHLKLFDADEAAYRKAVLEFIQKCAVSKAFQPDGTSQTGTER